MKNSTEYHTTANITQKYSIKPVKIEPTQDFYHKWKIFMAKEEILTKIILHNYICLDENLSNMQFLIPILCDYFFSCCTVYKT